MSNSTLDKLRMYKKLCRDVLKLPHLLFLQALPGAHRVFVQMSLFCEISEVLRPLKANCWRPHGAMAQFQLPAVRVVNPMELSARFCGERSRFSFWVRAANMSWRGSDRPMKCEHISPRVYAALTVFYLIAGVLGIATQECCYLARH